MDIPDIYVHDGTIFSVVEEPEHARITMQVELPNLERDEELERRTLVFEDVYGYQVMEGLMNGPITLLDFSVVGQESRWSRVRLDTGNGYREILCSSVRVLENDTKG